jgi:hypothetical protein
LEKQKGGEIQWEVLEAGNMERGVQKVWNKGVGNWGEEKEESKVIFMRGFEIILFQT